MGLDPLDLIFRLEKRFDIEIRRAEGLAVLFDTAGTLHRHLVAKLRGECHKVPEIEPLFTEVCGAVNRITKRWGLTLSLSTDLNRRFAPANRAAKWRALEEELGISLPQLEHRTDEAFPSIPRHCSSIMGLTYWIAEHHPELVAWVPVSCEGTGKMDTHQWSEDEVWAAMCECICDALGVDPEEVTYGARMVEDLGMG
jgi:acyl carrier protein